MARGGERGGCGRHDPTLTDLRGGRAVEPMDRILVVDIEEDHLALETDLSLLDLLAVVQENRGQRRGNARCRGGGGRGSKRDERGMEGIVCQAVFAMIQNKKTLCPRVEKEALAKLPEYAIVQRPPLRGHRLRNRGHRGGSRCGRGSGSCGLDGVQERWKKTTICIESRGRS